MKVLELMGILIIATCLFSQEIFYQEEENLSKPNEGSEINESFSPFVALQPTIDENLIMISSGEEVLHSIFNSYSDAVKIAQDEHKIILLELVSTNCKFCKEMESEVLIQEEVQEAIQKDFVLAQVNVDQEELPLGLSRQMTPMFVFISENENVEDMRLGYIEEKDFLLLLATKSKK